MSADRGLQRQLVEHQEHGRVGGAPATSSEPERVGKLFDAIASIVSNGKLALEQGDMKGLGQLMTMNQMLLELADAVDRASSRR